MDYGATAYKNAPKTRLYYRKYLRVVGDFSRTTLIHVLSQKQFQPQNKEEHGSQGKSVSLNISLGMTNRKLLETCDTTSTAKFNLLEKTALKIRHLVGALEKEEISFHEQTAQNLEVETVLEGIESAKRNYNDITLRQKALREIEMKKPALMVYTNGSIIGVRRGVGVYCETKGFEGRYKIEKDVRMSSADLKAIKIATNIIFQQDEQKAVILTDSRTAYAKC
jgi:hypothetical protein